MARPTRLERVRKICLALPEATEVVVEAWDGEPTFRVRNKVFVFAAPDGSSLTLKADPDERVALLADDRHYYVPAYVGNRGWVGVRVDRDTDWGELAELITTSYCMIAPKKLAALVEPGA
jgi:predicted DNA-binding protein (MmcQ/YjbR family)